MKLQIVKTLKVSVNYNGAEVRSLIKAGNYSWSDPDITPEHFPSVVNGVARLPSLLVAFDDLDHLIESEEVLDAFEAESLRPGKSINEILSLGAQHPNEQKEGPIVDLGSVWRDPLGHRFVPVLHRGGSERYLFLGLFVRGWRRCCRFLAFRKES